MSLFNHPDRIANMIRLDGSYLYDLGAAVHPLSNITDSATYLSLWFVLYVSQGEITRFINSSVYVNEIRATRQPAEKLLEEINKLLKKSDDDSIKNNQINRFEVYRLTEALKAFEIVLKAEFGLTPMFLATKKRGYDLSSLIGNGICLFPDEIQNKVPSSVSDINEGARCLAFELYTASGFHFHRANESVVLRYYDILSRGKPRPTSRNLGAYITALEAENAPPELITCLRDLKDLHRNPLIHPEHSIDNVDDAIGLLNAIHSAIVRMLKEIPKASP